MKTLSLLLLGLMILRSLDAIFIGARDGIYRRSIQRWGLRGPRKLTGHEAAAYGWFSLLGGSVLAALSAWGFMAVLHAAP